MAFQPLEIATTAEGIKAQGTMKRTFIQTLRDKKRPEHEIALRERELHVLQSAYAWLRHMIETGAGE